MQCPNNCTGLVQNILIETSLPYYANKLAQNIESRDGVTETEINTNPNITINLDINQSAYKKHNHFYYREDYENTEEFGVVDVDEGEVKLVYEGTPVTQAYKCLDCDELFHEELEIDESHEIDPTEYDWSLPV